MTDQKATWKKGPDGKLVRTLHGLAMLEVEKEQDAALAAQNEARDALVRGAVNTTFSTPSGESPAAVFARERTAAMQARTDARSARMREITAELRAIRRRTGLTQEQMGIELGKPQSRIAEAENNPSMGIDAMEGLLAAYKAIESMRPKAPTEK